MNFQQKSPANAPLLINRTLGEAYGYDVQSPGAFAQYCKDVRAARPKTWNESLRFHDMRALYVTLPEHDPALRSLLRSMQTESAYAPPGVVREDQPRQHQGLLMTQTAAALDALWERCVAFVGSDEARRRELYAAYALFVLHHLVRELQANYHPSFLSATLFGLFAHQTVLGPERVMWASVFGYDLACTYALHVVMCPAWPATCGGAFNVVWAPMYRALWAGGLGQSRFHSADPNSIHPELRTKSFVACFAEARAVNPNMESIMQPMRLALCVTQEEHQTFDQIWSARRV